MKGTIQVVDINNPRLPQDLKKLIENYYEGATSKNSWGGTYLEYHPDAGFVGFAKEFNSWLEEHGWEIANVKCLLICFNKPS